MKFFERSTTIPSKQGEDWSRTPAAMFASAVLGVAALGGLAWSWNRTVERDSVVALVDESGVAASAPEHLVGHRAEGAEGARGSAGAMGVVKLIDLNSAGAGELDLLPRIGPALAERILADRKENGRYDSVDDLKRVSGIGPKTVEKIRAFVTLGAESDVQASASAGEGG